MSDRSDVRDRGESNAAGFLALLFMLPLFWAFSTWLIRNIGSAEGADVSVPSVVSSGDAPSDSATVVTVAGSSPDTTDTTAATTTVAATSTTSTSTTSTTSTTVAPPAATAAPPPPVTVQTTAAPAVGYAPAPSWDHPFPTPQAGDYADAYARLNTMTIAPATTPLGYSRADWMNGWLPINGVPTASPQRLTGCDVRQMLFLIWAQPGTSQRDNTCRATSGVYVDGYVGGQYVIPADRAVAKTDAEHVVALHEAHLSGGAAWTAVQKNTLAMDYTVRSYHDGGTQLELTLNTENQSVKSDKDIAGYLPADPTTRCGFVVNVIAIKSRYGLSMDAEEATAALDYLDTCAAGGTPARP